MSRGFVVALLGAESTGKTTLARELRAALSRADRRVAVVDEYLREFCDHRARTPHINEQRAIAGEQTRRIDAAALGHEIVIADTTALMTAVYSDWVFGDRSLYDSAEAAQSTCDLTLLMAVDIAWEPDGLQRDGPQVQVPVDALIRAALVRAGCSFAVVAGAGSARSAAALASVERAMAPPQPPPTGLARWQWHCERCGDAGCERQPLLSPVPPQDSSCYLPEATTAICGSAASSLSSADAKNEGIR